MLDDLIIEFLVVLEDVSVHLLDLMKSHARDEDVRQSLTRYIYYTGFKELEAIVSSDHWKAFLDNYGTGSLMANESKNPNLEWYKSVFFHDYRPTNAVTAREQGAYVVPDWESGDGYITRYSNGRIPAGTNLETVNWNDYNVKFRPMPPSFFLEESMQKIEKEFKDELIKVYERFPFEKYISGGA